MLGWSSTGRSSGRSRRGSSLLPISTDASFDEALRGHDIASI